MEEIEFKDNIIVYYEDINDGEAICISEEDDGEVTDQIILTRTLALDLAKKITEMMGEVDN